MSHTQQSAWFKNCVQGEVATGNSRYERNENTWNQSHQPYLSLPDRHRIAPVTLGPLIGLLAKLIKNYIKLRMKGCPRYLKLSDVVTHPCENEATPILNYFKYRYMTQPIISPEGIVIKLWNECELPLWYDDLWLRLRIVLWAYRRGILILPFWIGRWMSRWMSRWIATIFEGYIFQCASFGR